MKLEDLPSYKKQLEATLLDHNGGKHRNCEDW